MNQPYSSIGEFHAVASLFMAVVSTLHAGTALRHVRVLQGGLVLALQMYKL